MPQKWNKTLKSTNELLNDLKQQGLKFEDTDLPKQFFDVVDYYRFKPFLSHLKRTSTEFKTDASFKKAIALYQFDLRQKISAQIEALETAIRAQFMKKIVLPIQDEFFYTQSQYFKSDFTEVNPRKPDQNSAHKAFLKIVKNAKSTSITHFRNKYISSDYVPFRMLGEVLTFGQFSRLISNLKDFELPAPNGKRRRPKNEFCQFFAYSIKEMESWLRSLVTLRNACAHAGSLWNLNTPVDSPSFISPKGKKLQKHIAEKNKIISRLVVLVALLRKIHSEVPCFQFHNDFLNQLIPMLNNIKGIFPNLEEEMGFPEGWQDNIFWKITF